MVLAGLAHGPVLLHHLPVGDRVDEITSKQVSSTASALVSSACYLAVVSWLTVGLTGLVATMYEQIGYSVADVVAKAVFGRADLGHRREFVSWCIWV